MGKEMPEPLSWVEKEDINERPEITQVTRPDDFVENIHHIREAIRNRPTAEGFLTLVGELLDRGLFDEAKEVAVDFKQWGKTKNQSDK